MRYLWIEIALCTVTKISTTAFVSIRFSTAHKELAHAKRCVENAAAQLRLHTKSYPQARGDPNKLTVTQGLDTTRMIYHEVVKSYNAVRRKPMNRFPAFVLEIRKAEEEV